MYTPFEIAAASVLVGNLDMLEPFVFLTLFIMAMITFTEGLFQWEEEVTYNEVNEVETWFEGEVEDELPIFSLVEHFLQEEVGWEFAVDGTTSGIVSYLDLLFALSEEELPMVKLDEQILDQDEINGAMSKDIDWATRLTELFLQELAEEEDDWSMQELTYDWV